MALTFSQGYMRGNGDPNIDAQIKDGGLKIPRLYIDDVTDIIYSFDDYQPSGSKWEIIFSPVTDKNTNLKVFLKQAMSGATMTTTLATSSLIPLTEPYKGLGYSRTQTETVSALSVFTTNNITDWVLVELRDKGNPQIIRYDRAGLLKNDGTIVDVDGIAPLEFMGIKNEKYYISVRHRNHLGVMTAAPVNVDDVIDFTSPSTPTFGTDAQSNSAGVMRLRGGKNNAAGYTKYAGMMSWYNDAFYFIDPDLQDINTVVTGVYSVYDVNLNGEVKFNLGGNDRVLVLNEVGVGAGNIIYEQIPSTTIDTLKVVFSQEVLNGISYADYTTTNEMYRLNTLNSNAKRYDATYGLSKVGLIIPKGTTAERGSVIDASSAGLVRYNTTDSKLEYYTGTVWVQL